MPLFSTIWLSTPRSRREPSFDIPTSSPRNMMSNSASLKGGAILFFTTLMRVRRPITSSPSFMLPMPRMSRRTEA